MSQPHPLAAGHRHNCCASLQQQFAEHDDPWGISQDLIFGEKGSGQSKCNEGLIEYKKTIFMLSKLAACC
jgi:hypothetical protein